MLFHKSSKKKCSLNFGPKYKITVLNTRINLDLETGVGAFGQVSSQI